MKKLNKIAAILVFTSLFVAFQNCGKTVQMGSEQPETFINQKFSLNQTEYVKVLDFKSNRFLEVNLETGEILPVEEFGDTKTTGSYCLPDQELNQLLSILQDSNVCQSESTSSKAEICQQYYTFPYAILISGANEIRLGERHDSCDSVVDLCSSKSDQLRKFTAAMVQNFANYVCGTSP